MTHAARLPAVLLGIVAAGLTAGPAVAAPTSLAAPAPAGSAAPARSAAPAVAAWSAATPLTASGIVSTPLPAPSVGMDAAGNAVAVFDPPTATNTVVAAFRPAGGAWSATTQISPSGASAVEPSVSVAPDGTAVAAWTAYVAGVPEIDIAFRAPGQGFGAPTRVATGQTPLSPRTGIDATGRATVVYALIDSAAKRHLYALTGTAAGLGAPTVLSPSTQDAGMYALAVNPAGQAVVTWQVASPDPNAYGNGLSIQAVRYAPATGWSAPVTVETGTDLWNGGLAIDAQGTALATWTSGPIDWTVPNAVRVATGAPSGTWSAARTVSGTTGAFTSPVVAVDGTGDAVVAWQTYLGTSTSSRIDAVTRTGATGAFSAPVTVSGSDTNALVPTVAAAPDGSLLVVAWDDAGTGTARVTTAVPGGSFATPTTLGRAQWDTAVGVAAAPGARAVAVWNEPVTGRHAYVVAAATLN